MTEAWIIDAVRTPRGRGRRGKGALTEVHPQELLAQTLRFGAERAHLDPSWIDDVVVGCVTQAGEQGSNLARNAVLSAGWPESVTGTTLNRFCGSGLQAVNFAAQAVLSGTQDFVVGAGCESMSRVPMGSDNAGLDGNHERLRETYFQVPQGISADLIATLEGIGRADLDRYALASQRRAAVAEAEGHFRKSLFPVRDPSTGAILLDRDEHPRADTTLDSLGQLKPAFTELGASPLGPNALSLDGVALKRYPQAGDHIEHVHTAGNSSGIVDGAAAVFVAAREFALAHGLKPRARLRALATHGAEPVIMLTAPAPTCAKALRRAHMTAKDVDLWEINEAFAVVPLQTMRALNIDPAKVNVNGGAIALGHPLGATGAVLLGTILDELERRGLGTGLVTLCIGGGQGIATIVERI